MNIDEDLKYNYKDARDPKKFEEILNWLKPIRKKGQEEENKVFPVILEELRSTGVTLKSIDDIVRVGRTYEDYKKILPILIKWFKKTNSPFVKDCLARDLSLKLASPEALKPLLEEFIKTPDTWIWHDAKWAIANAISVTANDAILHDLISLANDKKNGSGREMIVLALGNMKQPLNRKIAIENLVKLLNDEEVNGQAIVALRKLEAIEAEREILKFLHYPITWIRNEVKKTLKSFEKIHQSKN